MKKVEYRIGTITNNFPETESNIDLKEELELEAYTKLDNSLLYLEKLRMLFNLFEFIELNYSDFYIELNNSIKLYLQKMNYWNGFTDEDLEKTNINLNRVFLNYLSSYKSLIDYVETTINREFGKESNQLKEFKRLLSEIFDLNFSYRFFYKLRNYAQHIGLPIHNISFGHRIKHEENEYEANIKLSIDTKRLLNEFSDWGKVKNDLENFCSEIELTKVLDDNLITSRVLKKGMFQIYKDEIIYRIEHIENALIHYKAQKTEVFIGILTIHSDDRMILNNRKVQFDVFEWWKTNIKNSSS